MKLLIEKATNLPGIPKVVQELIVSFSNEKVNSDRIAVILSSDQALSAKVLRIANSVRYGGHRKVGSIKDAVIVLGIDSLRTLVLSVGFVSTLKAPEGFNIKAFWLKSFKVANRCKWLAKSLKTDPEVAYTCGLLHAIGEYLIHLVKPEEAILIDKRVAKGENRSRLEQQLLGFDFAKAGSELADYWHFPQDIVTAIRWQEQPGAQEEPSGYASSILIAQYMLDNEAKIEQGIFDDFPAKLVHSLHLNLAALYVRMENMTDIDESIEEFLH